MTLVYPTQPTIKDRGVLVFCNPVKKICNYRGIPKIMRFYYALLVRTYPAGPSYLFFIKSDKQIALAFIKDFPFFNLFKKSIYFRLDFNSFGKCG